MCQNDIFYERPDGDALIFMKLLFTVAKKL